MNVGSHDFFADDVQVFCRVAERHGAAVELDFMKGKCRGWQVDEGKVCERGYCRLERIVEVPESVMIRNTSIADGLLEVLKKSWRGQESPFWCCDP